MKRHGNLWPTLISFENLLRASEKAKRGKRFRPAVARFEFNLERELFTLQAALQRICVSPLCRYGVSRVPTTEADDGCVTNSNCQRTPNPLALLAVFLIASGLATVS
jgi:hypothetical protein